MRAASWPKPCSITKARASSTPTALAAPPRAKVHPFTVKVLTPHGLPVEALRSKGWREFAAPDAPMMDLIIAVCDFAANDVYPIWPGNPTWPFGICPIPPR